MGETDAERVAARVLAEGGNIYDAMVAGALAATVTSPWQTGCGGYGGCAMVARADGRIEALDFDTRAPAAARADLFAVDSSGEVPNQVNRWGWLAAGVPGNLAGLELLHRRHGTRPLGELMQPAIRLAREGFVVTKEFAGAVKSAAEQLSQDPGSRKLYFRDDRPLAAGERYANPDLAAMLAALAERGTVDAFYRGDIAQRVADAFAAHGGLVTTRDLAGYQATVEKPLALRLGDDTLHATPPPTGALTSLQALRLLVELDWARMPAGAARLATLVEALRLAWHDRLRLLADPRFAEVPADRLLSDEHAGESAALVREAVAAGKPRVPRVEAREQGGTIHLSGADAAGNFVALTLTHGEGFGARVTIDGLGLTLGHGMYRFDVEPSHPNAPGPGKRPLHNMNPVVATRDGKPWLALGGRGGRRIPNAAIVALAGMFLEGRRLEPALAVPRLHTEGTLALGVEKSWPIDDAEALRKFGYRVLTQPSAVLSAVAREDGKLVAAMR